ncbi:zinc-ribbon domain-containing protein [Bifidobacterium mongoliense]|uniref:zinc-ribbon domain-containing protein n=1 Tax=Bifidobacterium mongoliense TaxID=518643 RepID=UPI0026485F9B|nr:zinc-ribbon domain-containing protein [Bifidobacterium mongoliense]MDN6051387.1 serine hydrolase [Bifidobacterium mongoliense]
MYCTHCGLPNDPDARFCVSCGTPLEPDDQVPAQPEPVADADAPAMFPAATQYNTQQIPATPVAPAPHVAAYAPPVCRPNNSGNKTPIIIGAIAAVVAVACLVAFIAFESGAWAHNASPQPQSPTGDAPSATASPTSSSKHSTSSKHHKTKPSALDRATLDSIVNGYSNTDVSVAATTTTGAVQYTSQSGNDAFVAAGMYLPIYLAASDSHNQDAIDSANTMMSTMSNDDANSAVNALGGISAVTDWAHSHGYNSTEFNREFGDVQASNNGYENYTSSRDATKMLSAVIAHGGQNLMSYDVTTDGVSIPAGMSVKAHRGMGIKDSYNYFMVINDGGSTVSLAVMTQNQGKEQAAALTSKLLIAIHRGLQAR